MCERLKQTVLKTVIPERVSGVRIPLPPPDVLGFPHSARDLAAPDSWQATQGLRVADLLCLHLAAEQRVKSGLGSLIILFGYFSVQAVCFQLEQFVFEGIEHGCVLLSRRWRCSRRLWRSLRTLWFCGRSARGRGPRIRARRTRRPRLPHPEDTTGHDDQDRAKDVPAHGIRRTRSINRGSAAWVCNRGACATLRSARLTVSRGRALSGDRELYVLFGSNALDEKDIHP